MSLMDAAMADVIFMSKTRVPDGEGGFAIAWTEGATFKAAITTDDSLQAKIAEKQGVTSLYRVYTNKSITLDYHDVIKRVSDGKILRITSDAEDMKTPDSATFEFAVTTAEEWVLV